MVSLHPRRRHSGHLHLGCKKTAVLDAEKDGHLGCLGPRLIFGLEKRYTLVCPWDECDGHVPQSSAMGRCRRLEMIFHSLEESTRLLSHLE